MKVVYTKRRGRRYVAASCFPGEALGLLRLELGSWVHKERWRRVDIAGRAHLLSPEGNGEGLQSYDF